jgi:transposase-like protein
MVKKEVNGESYKCLQCGYSWTLDPKLERRMMNRPFIYTPIEKEIGEKYVPTYCPECFKVWNKKPNTHVKPKTRTEGRKRVETDKGSGTIALCDETIILLQMYKTEAETRKDALNRLFETSNVDIPNIRSMDTFFRQHNTRNRTYVNISKEMKERLKTFKIQYLKNGGTSPCSFDEIIWVMLTNYTLAKR